jgi:ribosome-associated protein
MRLPRESRSTSIIPIVEISREPIELYKILKFEGMAASGGEAKAVVAAGQVLVNGKVETQKRKKIVSGDTIEFNSKTITIRFTPPVVDEAMSPRTAVEPVANDPVVEPTSDSSAAADVEKE